MKHGYEFPIYFKGDLKQLRELARMISLNLEGGEVFGLVGDLGAGKTTFSQMLGSELGIDQRMASPTFLIHKKYEARLPLSKRAVTLNHLDVYRLFDKPNLDELGLMEIFQDRSAITLIEWADKLAEQLPKSVKYIYFENRNEN